jgi:hypothetical protein
MSPDASDPLVAQVLSVPTKPGFKLQSVGSLKITLYLSWPLKNSVNISVIVDDWVHWQSSLMLQVTGGNWGRGTFLLFEGIILQNEFYILVLANSIWIIRLFVSCVLSFWTTKICKFVVTRSWINLSVAACWVDKNELSRSREREPGPLRRY